MYDSLKSVVHYLGDLGYNVGLTGKDHVTKPQHVFPFTLVRGFEPNCVAPTDNYELTEIKNFITQSKDPYCLFVMSINPHAPWTVGDTTEFPPDKLILPANWVDTKETRRQFMKYLAEVRRLDNQVGDIVQLLKETGEDKNTIVIFLGEQGAQFPGSKWNLWDAGQKAAMIVKWPHIIKGGTRSEILVQYEDVTPTLIDIAGGKPINGLDGKSFLPALHNSHKTARKYVYGIHNNIPEGNAYAIRSIRDSRYKLILNLSSGIPYYNRFMMDAQRKDRNSVWFSWLAEANNNPQAKFITHRFENRPPVEFYDTSTDPFELNNLADNPSYKAKIEAHRVKLLQWMSSQGDRGAEIDIVYPKKTE